METQCEAGLFPKRGIMQRRPIGGAISNTPTSDQSDGMLGSEPVVYKDIASESVRDTGFLDPLQKTMQKRGVPAPVIDSLFSSGRCSTSKWTPITGDWELSCARIARPHPGIAHRGLR